MTLKRLHELSTSEISAELGKAGILGDYIKSEAIVRLTIFVVGIREDPFTFLFNPDIATDDVDDSVESVSMDCEFSSEAAENVQESVIGVPVAVFADDVSAESAEISDDDAITEDSDAGNEALENATKSRAVDLSFSVKMSSYGFPRVFSKTLTSLSTFACVICSESSFLSKGKYLRPPVNGGNEFHFIKDINEETNEVRLEWKPPDTVYGRKCSVGSQGSKCKYVQLFLELNHVPVEVVSTVMLVFAFVTCMLK